MGGGFDHAQNAAKADRERLQSRALDLQRRVAAPGLEKKEINALTEELHGVIERLALTQHSLDTWTVVQQALVEEEEGEEGGPSEGAAPPVRQTPMLQAVVAREEALPERKASKPLGQQLLADFRRLVRPTLVEQLEGLDSPFQPPSVISVALERALRQHLNKVRQEYDPAHQSDEERPSMSLELGRALVELLRAIAHEQRLTAPRSGIDAVRERERLHSAMGAGEAFQAALWRSVSQQGKRVNLRLGQEEVEISVTHSTTFDSLMNTAASYWKIDASNYVVGDERGVQFIRSMSVLEGLRLCPPLTKLELIPLFSEEKAKLKLTDAAAGGRKKLDLSFMTADKAAPQAARDDEEDYDGEEGEGKVKMSLFGLGDGKMSRFHMLVGMFQTAILVIFFYLAIQVRVDLADEQPVCVSLTEAFTQRQFTSEKGFISSFDFINSATAFREWLLYVLPDVLFGHSTTLRESRAPENMREQYDSLSPAVISGHTVLLGGLRLLQHRGNTATQGRCTSAPFLPRDSFYPHSAYTSMINQENLGSDSNILDDPAARDQRIEELLTAPSDYGNVSQCFQSSQTSPSTTSFGPMRANADASEQDPSNPQSPASADLPPTICVPACVASEPAAHPGALGAFVYQNATDLGLPYSLTASKYVEGGYAITFPGNVTYNQYMSTISRVLNSRWFDRQTRSVHINMILYNLQHHLVTNVQLDVNFDTSGSISSTTACAAVAIEDLDYVRLIPETLLMVWLIYRGVLITSTLFIKKLPEPGEKPVRCLITMELCVHVITTTLGIIGTAFRVLFLMKQQDLRHLVSADQAGQMASWPPPFTADIGAIIDLLRTSVYYYAWALLMCTMRFSLYYSIISKRLYILRVTIFRATARLLPTLLLLVASLCAFAIGGNQLYYTTTYEWRDPASSIGTVLYLLRRPMGMNWKRMELSAMLWPLDSEEPSPVTIVFLLSFTTVTIWIMANLYRAVIIQEYATVAQLYQNSPPGDLTSDPWPSVRGTWQRWKEGRVERLHENRISRRRASDWKTGLEAQKRKQKSLVEEIKKRHSVAEEKANGKGKASAKAGNGVANGHTNGRK